MMNFFITVLLTINCAVLWDKAGGSSSSHDHSRKLARDADMANAMRETVRDMFAHGYGSYLTYAYPRDELKPLTCTGADTWGPFALTLVDSLDTLVLLGNYSEFARAADLLANTLDFDLDKNVSVFETNIRVLGGLLSAHMLAMQLSNDSAIAASASASSSSATQVVWLQQLRQQQGNPQNIFDAGPTNGQTSSLRPPLSPLPDWTYSGKLLELARDLGDRLLPAFDTATGIPYGTVNFRHGVPSKETPVTSLAGGGTHLIEFGLLSRLTGDAKYERAARGAARALWALSSELGLPGNHIDTRTGVWTLMDTSIGSNADSYYEYLLKAYVLLGESEYAAMFQDAYRGVVRHAKHGPWYVDVHMNRAQPTLAWFTALSGFWPGLQALYGDVAAGSQSMHAFHQIWRSLGFVPEAWNLQTETIVKGQEAYHLRPEMAESLMYLRQATGDPVWHLLGRDMIAALEEVCWTPCGYAIVRNVSSHALGDRMESFFLSETLKYLWLLYDDSSFIHHGNYIFSTEGHYFPVLAALQRRAPGDTPPVTPTSGNAHSGGGNDGRNGPSAPPPPPLPPPPIEATTKSGSRRDSNDIRMGCPLQPYGMSVSSYGLYGAEPEMLQNWRRPRASAAVEVLRAENANQDSSPAASSNIELQAALKNAIESSSLSLNTLSAKEGTERAHNNKDKASLEHKLNELLQSVIAQMAEPEPGKASTKASTATGQDDLKQQYKQPSKNEEQALEHLPETGARAASAPLATPAPLATDKSASTEESRTHKNVEVKKQNSVDRGGRTPATDDSAASSPVQVKLQPTKQRQLRYMCFKHAGGYWSYEMCFGRKTRQYHQSEKGVVLTEHLLGFRHVADRVRDAGSLDAVRSAMDGLGIDPAPSVGENATAGERQLFEEWKYALNRKASHVHVYTGGEACKGIDLSVSSGRAAVISYYCASNLSAAVKSKVDTETKDKTKSKRVRARVTVSEPSACVYRILIESEHFC